MVGIGVGVGVGVGVGEGVTTSEGVAVGEGVAVAKPGSKGKPAFTAPSPMPKSMSTAPRIPRRKRVAKEKGPLTGTPSIFPLIGRMPSRKAKKPHRNKMTSKGELRTVFKISGTATSFCG